MKTTPIYILLIIFFLNFDLAWGLVPDIRDLYLLQGLYTVQKDSEVFHSINLVYDIGTQRQIIRNRTFNRLRLNIGLSKILTELDYNLGYRLFVFNRFGFEPYISTGTNIYSVSYGVGFDLHYYTRSRWAVIANLNYRSTEKLFGNTDAQQWYQKGVGIKIGVEYLLDILISKGYCQSD